MIKKIFGIATLPSKAEGAPWRAASTSLFTFLFFYFFIFFSSLFTLHSSLLFAVEPFYIAELPNIHEYDLFANGGWNGNWYVGYDHCWIVKLPPALPKKNYKRAFLGVKIGRAKTEKQIRSILGTSIDDKKKKLELATEDEKGKILAEIQSLGKKEEKVGEITFYISVSQDSDFSDDKKYAAARGSEIPIEGDSSEALNYISEGAWFWTEVPMDIISDSVGKNNFVAVWSDNPLLTSAEFAPVIAAGWSDTNENAYLTTNNQGAPPKELEKQISYFTPAICMKLVPEPDGKITVSVKNAKIEKDVLCVSAEVSGEMRRVGWRLFKEDNEGIPTGYGVTAPPYCLTVRNLKPGRYRFYIEATDYFERRAQTEEKTFVVE